MKNYAEILKSHELKSTIQRLAILNIIENHGHISLEDIYADIKKAHPSVSLNTIYLNIQTMCEKGILIEVPIQNAKPKYEIAKESHFHFVCRVCGLVEDEEAQIDTTQEIFSSISQKREFNMDSASVTIYGKCKNC